MLLFDHVKQNILIRSVEKSFNWESSKNAEHHQSFKESMPMVTTIIIMA